MALFIRQDENRSELQKRVATQVQERAKEQAKKFNDSPDGVDDSRYIEGTKSTTSLAWLWAVGIFVAVAAIIWLTVTSLSR
jgi:type VI protein secretion system component VasF